LAASLEHPHIVPIHAAGEADGVLYLAMRYVEGRDLAGLLRSLGRLDPERTIALLGQVASALDTAHTRGLVHRDVKPANILVSRTSTTRRRRSPTAGRSCPARSTRSSPPHSRRTAISVTRAAASWLSPHGQRSTARRRRRRSGRRRRRRGSAPSSLPTSAATRP